MNRFIAPAILVSTLALTGFTGIPGVPSSLSRGPALEMAKGMFASVSLVSSLGSSLNMNPMQAAGGLGSLTSLAKSKLSPTDFGAFSKMLPGGDKYLQFAQQTGLVSSPVTDAAGLDSNLAKLGMSPDMPSGFLGKMGEYFGSKGGAQGSKLLAGLLAR